MTQQPPPLDMSALMQGAIASHEMFMAYVEAGFTREEALAIVIGILTHGMGDRT